MGIRSGGLDWETPCAGAGVVPTLSPFRWLAGAMEGSSLGCHLPWPSSLAFSSPGDSDPLFSSHFLPPRAESKFLLHAPGVFSPPNFFFVAVAMATKNSAVLYFLGPQDVGDSEGLEK